jgi:hemolysin III
MPLDATMRTASARELTADAIVHALGVGLGVPAAVAVVIVAALVGTAGQIAPAVVYAFGLVAMVGCSAAYNVLRTHRWSDWLQRFDHAAIFAMIAGTYTPFTVQLEHNWALGLTVSVWTIAALGILLKLWRPRRIGSVSVIFYLALGWIGVLALGPFLDTLAAATLVLIGIGGLIYSAGVIFHLWHRLPYQNAIWHGFVLTAAGVHYAAVLTAVVG